MVFYQITIKVTKITVRLVQHKWGRLEVHHLLWLLFKAKGLSATWILYFFQKKNGKQNAFNFTPIWKSHLLHKPVFLCVCIPLCVLIIFLIHIFPLVNTYLWVICMWSPKIDIGTHFQLFFCAIYWSRVHHSNSEPHIWLVSISTFYMDPV